MFAGTDRLVIGGKYRNLVGVCGSRVGSITWKKWGSVYVLFLGFLEVSAEIN
ncbi:hypothetical protein WN55_03504 [Dufourea novaeangliae]|uniref:Uncharacterized protein n=1 Tax=Dufourea novaeangliae TaxID=178035 RepID=A0A154PJF9_DUFNO|nr:hypothetical protein WN55_03504 [Dufourea novaeangliae]